MRYQCFKSKKNRRDFQQDKSSLAVCTVREDKTSRVELSSLYRESSSLSHTARRVRLAQGVESVLRSKSGMSHAASRFESSLLQRVTSSRICLFQWVNSSRICLFQRVNLSRICSFQRVK